jgi:methylated-DNA-[protein]-cysteine S-methyltransferase
MTTLRHHTVPSPLGPLLLVRDDAERLRGLYLPAHRRGPEDAPGRADDSGVLADAAAQLDAYFAGGRTTFDLPLATDGGPLQERVWAALRAVPYGTTTTYGAIAASLGLGPGAARAVGTANARNPISIVVPCHRVIGAGGALVGRLLAHEARVAGGALDLDDDACWAIHERRDARADGRFLIGVRTSGVYCRPSCPGRPRRENVFYVRDAAAARRHGLRPCRRCTPDAA